MNLPPLSSGVPLRADSSASPREGNHSNREQAGETVLMSKKLITQKWRFVPYEKPSCHVSRYELDRHSHLVFAVVWMVFVKHNVTISVLLNLMLHSTRL
ncbi:hypothetical protein F2P81_022923 [Scophthalmus maximus]|uniref:Uncharacterized protein n=1 Tax=Scophthalmus maximus TaxID=52904 RepID=A0A6A4RYR5_SCOMX|nr:hypothetical protein F2P81_022923 [Scophthalmus maximus]